jgi:hypothetical protein
MTPHFLEGADYNNIIYFCVELDSRSMGEVCKGVIKLEKPAKKFGGDKYGGCLRSSSAGMSLVTMYIPQSLSRQGSSCRPKLQIGIYRCQLNTDLVKDEDVIKTYRFQLDKPAKSGGGDRFVATSDPDFNIYLPQIFSRRWDDEGESLALRQITMVVSAFTSASAASPGSRSPAPAVKAERSPSGSVDTSASTKRTLSSPATGEASATGPNKVRRIICDSEDEDDENTPAIIPISAPTLSAASSATSSSNRGTDIDTVVSEQAGDAPNMSTETIESKL